MKQKKYKGAKSRDEESPGEFLKGNIKEDYLIPFPNKDANLRDGKEIKTWMNGWEAGYHEGIDKSVALQIAQEKMCITKEQWNDLISMAAAHEQGTIQTYGFVMTIKSILNFEIQGYDKPLP